MPSDKQIAREIASETYYFMMGHEVLSEAEMIDAHERIVLKHLAAARQPEQGALRELVESQQPLDPKIAKALNEDFGELFEPIPAAPTETAAPPEGELISRKAAMRKAAETIYITCWPKDEEDAEVIISSITDILSRALPAVPTDEQPCPDPRCNDDLGAMPMPQCATAVAWAQECDELREALREYAELVHESERHLHFQFDECLIESCVRARKLLGD